MRISFPKTHSRLLADNSRNQFWVLASAGFLLSAWLWWASRAQIVVYEVSPKARLELSSSTYPVESPVLGRVAQTKLRAGEAVQRGEVLVQLDPVSEELLLRQQEATAAGLKPEITRLQSQIAAEEKARLEERHTADVDSEEARNRIQEAEATVRYDEADLSRTQKLQREGLAPEKDVEKADAELRRQRAVLAALQNAERRIPQEQLLRERERDVRVARLHGEIAAIQTQWNTLDASISRASYEVERRAVRAPVDGRIGESVVLRPGAVVQPGEKLGSIVPSGKLIVVSEFPARSAFGRIRPGQIATLRLDGFPWAEFGTVSAKVSEVAAEIRDGNARVELEIQPGSSFRGTLEHGMPGTLEVVVERATPLSLVMRSAGQWLTAHR